VGDNKKQSKKNLLPLSSSHACMCLRAYAGFWVFTMPSLQ